MNHLDGGDSLGATVSDRDRCVGLETYLHDGQVEASSEASGSSSYEEATRKLRGSYEEATSGATKEVGDLGVRAPKDPPRPDDVSRLFAQLLSYCKS